MITLPPKLGKARADAVYDWVIQGAVPRFLQRWEEVTFKENGHDVTFYCTPDFLCLGTDKDWVYAPIGALTAEQIGKHLNAHLPTPKMVDIIYAKSNKQVAQPWGPPYDHSMTDTSRWRTQSDKIQAAPNFRQGSLMEGHLKNVCVSKKMESKKGEWLSFYGWYNADGSCIQGNNVNAHGAEYADYAHGVRYVLNEVVIDGYLLTMDEALQHDELHSLFEPEGVMKFGNYSDCRAYHDITSVRY